MKWCRCLPCTKVNEEDITVLDFSCSLLLEVPVIVFNFERTLQHLYLDGNKIMELPRTLFQCEELRYLGLCDNEIETIPPLIEKLTNLESLLLNRNCLVAESIPANIHRCQKLKVLHLSSNSITNVPGPITRLVSLKELYLNNCDLDFLPANFGRLNNLQILELRENNLVTLPKSLKRLVNLQRLDISSNLFKKFPEVIGTMTNLTELWLNDNFLLEIEDCIGALDKLTHFDASCNRLENVTHNLGLCTSMTLLLFSMNNLKELPSTIGELSILHTLKLDHNFLESLPPSIGKLSNLEELDVQFNNLKSFPNSIGMLRKLNSLVAAQNSIAYLPSEIGSCISLSVLSLHYNMLVYLPQEMGHLQNLTSISLINNRLQYLPIAILGLKKLKALWLSHNQIQPLITLQTETLDNGQLVLVCVFLPQVEIPPSDYESIIPIMPSSGRRIGFKEPNMENHLPARLSRIPTPHPKAFVKYQRTSETAFRRSQGATSKNLTVNAVKEASIVPMKEPTGEAEVTLEDTFAQISGIADSTSFTGDTKNYLSEEMQNLSSMMVQSSSESRNFSEDVETNSECLESVISGQTCSSTGNTSENIILYDNSSENIQIVNKSSGGAGKEFQCNGIRPKEPPPYHIAATYSKTAHLFTNDNVKKVKEEIAPKHFTQDQPPNILNPHPKHALCIQRYENMYNNKYGDSTSCLRDDVEIINQIFKIIAKLLILNNQQHRHLFEEFILLKTGCIQTLGTFDDLFDIKLRVLNTALFLLNEEDSFELPRNALHRSLEGLQQSLDMIGNDFSSDLHSINIEVNNKFCCLNTSSLMLEANLNNKDDLDMIHHLLGITDLLFPNNMSNLKCDLKLQTIFEAKFNLVKLLIYFLSLDVQSKEYHYILEKFIKLKEKFIHIGKMNLRENSKIVLAGEQYKSDCVQTTEPLSTEKQKLDNIKWLFGIHRNPKILKIEVTRCCYVLGFTFNYSNEGVFVEKVDQNGNAYNKLFPGDQILMLDDRDISKMNSEDALKAVQIWGPETETFLVSRN